MNIIMKCTQYDLMKAKAKLGQMYFVTDSRLLYKDNGPNIEQRFIFNAIILNNDVERTTYIKPVIGKFYYVEETNCLWLFDTRWVLKIGNHSEYNTYYAGNYISPVINTDESITGAYGDKIIDNNGLLGDGSVVVRDANRITRGLYQSNNTYNRLEMKSYLDDGLLFIPNAHLPYKNLSSSLGALHLSVEKKEALSNVSLKLNGVAHYYGDWNNYGSVFIIQQDSSDIIHPDYIPINDYEIIKYYITCTKKTSDGVLTTHIVIRPISDSLSLVHIISVVNENSNSVVQNDMGELIFTHDGDIVDNVVIECKRTISNSGECKMSHYYFDNYGETITIKQDKNDLLLAVDIGKTWADESSETTISMNRWIKDEVLTRRELEKQISMLKEEINKLKNSN